MKIATWNLNSIRRRLDLLTKLIQSEEPDIILLQETKVINELFPYAAIKALGYNYLHYEGQKSYNGVAILSKIAVEKSFSLNLFNEDKRHYAIKVKDVEIHNFYVPAGGDIPDISINPKFKHKLAYINLIQEWFKANRTNRDKIILAGDLNIAPYEHDVWSSKQLANVVSHTSVERSSFLELKRQLNLIDSARYFVPLDEKFYTWWSYRNIDWQKTNRGRKLDHILISKNLQHRLVSGRALSHIRAWDSPSDHVPYIIKIRDE